MRSFYARSSDGRARSAIWRDVDLCVRPTPGAKIAAAAAKIGRHSPCPPLRSDTCSSAATASRRPPRVACAEAHGSATAANSRRVLRVRRHVDGPTTDRRAVVGPSKWRLIRIFACAQTRVLLRKTVMIRHYCPSSRKNLNLLRKFGRFAPTIFTLQTLLDKSVRRELRSQVDVHAGTSTSDRSSRLIRIFACAQTRRASRDLVAEVRLIRVGCSGCGAKLRAQKGRYRRVAKQRESKRHQIDASDATPIWCPCRSAGL